jgi:DNA repair exonuclease SbcCD nuclease subunit
LRILRVGDPHVKVTNIEESERLVEFVAEKAVELKVDRIEILGDLFHTHAIIRLEVLDFWLWALELLSDICEVIVLIGNHDQSGDYSSNSSALDVFTKIRNDNLKVVGFGRLEGIFAYLPYIHNRETFVTHANHLAEKGAKVLVCHQTFEGSKYENGFYAPDGVDPESISEDYIHIISGHIHSRQEFGRVDYPGTARWDTASDANQPKGIGIYDHEDGTGRITNRQFLSTEGICRPIYKLSWREGQNPPVIPADARVSIELIGSSAWVTSQKELLQGKCSISTKITDRTKTEERKTGNSLEQFLTVHFDIVSGIDRGKLIQYMKDLKIV